MSLAFFVATTVFLMLGLHPFITYPASLAILARWRGRSILSENVPPPAGRVALCVCAYNEERIIQAKAENMLAMRQAVPNLDLLVYVDAASDRTAELLQGFSDQIRTIVGEGRHGKTYGMNRLVATTDAEYVVFSDANVMFARDAIIALLRPFQDPEVGCVSGHLVYTGGSGNATASAGSAYWRHEEMIKELESRTGSTMGADGSIFAIRRALHYEAPPDIIDDMFVSLSILCDGYRVVRADKALAYEETVSRSCEEFRRKIRIACQAFNVHRLLWPRLVRLSMLDRYKYVSHKLLRWLAIYWFGLAALCAMFGLHLMGHTRVTIAIGLLGMTLGIAGLAKPTGPLRKLMEIFLAFVATGLGVLQSLRGERFQVWTPPASARASKQMAR
jgi:cellulose synthase/poly-beta-1,6-N-acetylglucosamine synthase-like glycosyltransferase